MEDSTLKLSIIWVEDGAAQRARLWCVEGLDSLRSNAPQKGRSSSETGASWVLSRARRPSMRTLQTSSSGLPYEQTAPFGFTEVEKIINGSELTGGDRPTTEQP